MKDIQTESSCSSVIIEKKQRRKFDSASTRFLSVNLRLSLSLSPCQSMCIYTWHHQRSIFTLVHRHWVARLSLTFVVVELNRFETMHLCILCFVRFSTCLRSPLPIRSHDEYQFDSFIYLLTNSSHPLLSPEPYSSECNCFVSMKTLLIIARNGMSGRISISNPPMNT